MALRKVPLVFPIGGRADPPKTCDWPKRIRQPWEYMAADQADVRRTDTHSHTELVVTYTQADCQVKQSVGKAVAYGKLCPLCAAVSLHVHYLDRKTVAPDKTKWQTQLAQFELASGKPAAVRNAQRLLASLATHPDVLRRVAVAERRQAKREARPWWCGGKCNRCGGC